MNKRRKDNMDRKYASIEELRRRSQEGFLKKITNPVIPVQETIQKPSLEEEYDEIVASIFDD